MTLFKLLILEYTSIEPVRCPRYLSVYHPSSEFHQCEEPAQRHARMPASTVRICFAVAVNQLSKTELFMADLDVALISGNCDDCVSRSLMVRENLARCLALIAASLWRDECYIDDY